MEEKVHFDVKRSTDNLNTPEKYTYIVYTYYTFNLDKSNFSWAKDCFYLSLL